MLTAEGAVTLLVVAAKEALIAPAGMVTPAGTLSTAVLLLESETRAPPLGAGPFSVTRPETGDPSTTVLGLRVTEVSVGPAEGCGVTVREALCVRPEFEAEIVTVVEVVAEEVVTGNATAVAPAGTVTLDGMVATAVLLLDRESATPPLGALLRVICPVEEFPPLTLVGLRASENGVAEF